MAERTSSHAPMARMIALRVAAAIRAEWLARANADGLSPGDRSRPQGNVGWSLTPASTRRVVTLPSSGCAVLRFGMMSRVPSCPVANGGGSRGVSPSCETPVSKRSFVYRSSLAPTCLTANGGVFFRPWRNHPKDKAGHSVGWYLFLAVHPVRRLVRSRRSRIRLARLAWFILYNPAQSTTRAHRSTPGNTA